MIILKTINHDNKNIEYHFAHDSYKGIVFKINSNFDIVEDEGEHYMTCDYNQLDHDFNDIVITAEEISIVCDEFAMATLQSLLTSVKATIENDSVGNLDDNK